MTKRRIAITGASSGIGREVAIALATEDNALLLVARRDLTSFATELEKGGARQAVSVSLDLGDLDAAQSVGRHLDALEGDTSVLINCAGVARFGPYLESPFASHAMQIQVNLLGTMAASYAVLPQMLKEQGGQIINVLSIAATNVFSGAEAYSASKAGALAFSRSLSASYRGQGIRIMSVLPGATDTPIWGEVGPDRGQMLASASVAQAIRDLVYLPSDRVVDELTITPPRGIL